MDLKNTFSDYGRDARVTNPSACVKKGKTEEAVTA